MDYVNKIINGDTLETLKQFSPESIDMVMTSPPYWALRDYGTAKWESRDKNCNHEVQKNISDIQGDWERPSRKEFNKVGELIECVICGKSFYGKMGNKFCSTKCLNTLSNEQRQNAEPKRIDVCKKCGAKRIDQQLGLEPTFQEYITKLCNIFDEVKRVLKKTGTCWVNIGDTYYSKSGSNYEGSKMMKNRDYIDKIGLKTCNKLRDNGELQSKNLCNIPARFSIEMQNRDTMDIYELDKSFILCNNIDITQYKTGGQDALQRPNKSQRIQHSISSEMEGGTSPTIPQTNEGVARKKSGQVPSIQQEVLLGTQRTRNNQSNEGQCEISSASSLKSTSSIWWKSSKVCLLWRNNFIIPNDTPSKQRWSETQERTKKIWLNFPVVKEQELSERFRSFVYELQLGNREIWILPPSRKQNFSLRKRDIPLELLPLFHLKTPERWLLRNTIIWHKPNCMPSSVKDRFTVDFEYVFFFVKNKRYWFETQYEPHESPPEQIRRQKRLNNPSKYGQWIGGGSHSGGVGYNPQGRNKRCVWTIPTKPFKEAHFAVFPEALVETPIKAGCPKNGIVLDPFVGSGTTCVVAKKLGRNYCGIDLNPDYCKMAEKRLQNTMGCLL